MCPYCDECMGVRPDSFLPAGKCNRGLMVIGSLKHLTEDRELSQEEERKGLILGWCVEWVGPCSGRSG